jgi:hypothetical protein
VSRCPFTGVVAGFMLGHALILAQFLDWMLASGTPALSRAYPAFRGSAGRGGLVPREVADRFVGWNVPIHLFHAATLALATGARAVRAQPGVPHPPHGRAWDSRRNPCVRSPRNGCAALPPRPGRSWAPCQRRARRGGCGPGPGRGTPFPRSPPRSRGSAEDHAGLTAWPVGLRNATDDECDWQGSDRRGKSRARVVLRPDHESAEQARQRSSMPNFSRSAATSALSMGRIVSFFIR